MCIKNFFKKETPCLASYLAFCIYKKVFCRKILAPTLVKYRSEYETLVKESQPQQSMRGKES